MLARLRRRRVLRRACQISRSRGVAPSDPQCTAEDVVNPKVPWPACRLEIDRREGKNEWIEVDRARFDHRPARVEEPVVVGGCGRVEADELDSINEASA